MFGVSSGRRRAPIHRSPMVDSSAFPLDIGRSISLEVPVVVAASSIGLGAVLCTEPSMLGLGGLGGVAFGGNW